jgi:TolA-binding protein
MAEKDNLESGLGIGEAINGFIQKNRKVLVFCLAAAVFVVVGLVTAFTVRDKVVEKNWSRVEEFTRRYEALRFYINSDDPDALSRQADIAALRSELTSFAEKESGFVSARAYALTAGIYGDEKNWVASEEAWVNAARAAAKTYFAPISLYRAALAAEERGNLSGAVDYYRQVLDQENFPAAPRAQFAIGRIQEGEGSEEAALESYRTLVSRWPNDPLWASLAQSRILFLESRQN